LKNLRRGSVLSLERYGDQQLRRRVCPEFVADRAMILMLLEVILFYKPNFTSKERFHAGWKARFALSNHSMKLNWSLDEIERIMIDHDWSRHVTKNKYQST
jgi:hypothetical protein